MTRSTYGALEKISSPSCCATQPQTPSTTSGRRSLSGFSRPSSEKTFSAAFSRIEHVFKQNDVGGSARFRANVAVPLERPDILSASRTFI